MIKLSILITFLAVMLCIQSASAQLLDRNVVSNGGESSNANNITLTFTLGEFIGELLGAQPNGKILTTGFIQGDQVINNPFAVITRELAVFPNPTAGDNAKLDLRNMPDGNYIVEICDVIGRILFTKNIQYTKDYSLSLDLDISRFKGGTYYVRVHNELIKGTVKLIKL
ncbi:MAG: T9SS type A sorting domain-containing protein [Chryseobacterium sp.]|nr:MAG: T9SS type A sorting domain-containing protein [Chryseobacterium sp.]